MVVYSESGNLYYLGQNDKSGVLLGLTMKQTVIVGVGMFAMVIMRLAGFAFLITVVPVVGAAAFAKTRYQGRWLSDWIPVLARWFGRRNRTQWSTDQPWDGENGERPRVFDALTVRDEQMSAGPTAVVWDSVHRTAAAIIEVRGCDFELLEAREQDGLLADFGRAIGVFVQEGTPVVRASWHEVAFRQSLDAHRRFVREVGTSVDAGHRRAYLALVDEVGASTTRHSIYLTVVVGQAQVEKGGRVAFGAHGRTSEERTVAALDKSLGVFARRLSDSGIEVTRWLEAADVRQVLTEAIDPSTALGLAPQAGRLSDRMGTSTRMGPMEVDESFNWMCTDGTYHRSYRITEWPRTAQHGDWLVRLLARPESARTMAVVFEPVNPVKSQRQIERALAKLDAVTTVRAESGKRVTYAAQRAREDVLQREEELVSGFGEVRYWSVVTVSATSVDGLVSACEEWEASAGSVGLVLSPCDGEHELGWGASLPLSLGATIPAIQL